MEAPQTSPLLSSHEQLGILALRFLHDLANHASAFYGFSSILGDEVPPGAPGREMVEQLTAAADRFGAALSEFGSYKNALSGRLPVISAMETALAVAAGLSASPGWAMSQPGELMTGQRLAADPRWLQHLTAVVSRRGNAGGDVHFRITSETGEVQARIEFQFRGPAGLADRTWFETEAARPDLACAREIVRRFGGRGEVDVAAGRLTIRLPLAA